MKRKQIISGVSTVLCTALVLGLSACGGKTNTPQTIPAVNDTVKDTAKDGASDASRELDAASEKDASTKQIYDDRLITDAASLEDYFKGADGVEYKVSIHPRMHRRRSSISRSWISGEIFLKRQRTNIPTVLSRVSPSHGRHTGTEISSASW